MMSHHPLRMTLTTPPAVEPVSVSELKDHLRLDTTDEDALLATLITAARESCEGHTGRALITQGWSLFLDHWPGKDALPWWDGVMEGADILHPVTALPLPRPPLQGVSAVNIYDAEDTAAVWAAENYYVDTASTPGRIVLRSGGILPNPGRAANGLEVRFTAGYGNTATDVPQSLIQGVKLLAAHWYENRGDTPARALIDSGAAALWQNYRVTGLV